MRSKIPAVLFLVTACGGSPAPASPATPAAAAPPASAATPAASAEPAAPAAPAASANAPPPTPEPAAEEPAVTKSMSERLLAPTISYMLNYASSGARDKTAAACEAAAKDDPAAKAACIEKERSKLVADVLLFDKTAKGTIWTIYQRRGSNLTEIWSGPVEFSNDGPAKITVKVLKAEHEKGYRQLFAGKKEFSIDSASDSSIELDDPQLGKLLYEARIGLVDRKPQ